MDRRKTLTPGLIDALNNGHLVDATTAGFSIQVLTKGTEFWFYRRRVARDGAVVKLTLGSFSAINIADACKWAEGLNKQIERGITPRIVSEKEAERERMTVSFAQALYMDAVRRPRIPRKTAK